jgi:hypothetical protein
MNHVPPSPIRRITAFHIDKAQKMHLGSEALVAKRPFAHQSYLSFPKPTAGGVKSQYNPEQ